MSAFEGNPPNTPGDRIFDEHAATIPPPERKTPPPTPESELLAVMLRIEGHVHAIDRGLMAANDEISAIRADMRQGFEGQRDQILRVAQDVGLLREQASSALGAINVLPPRLTAIEEGLDNCLNVACTTWLQVTGGELDDEQRERTKQIAVSHYSGRRG